MFNLYSHIQNPSFIGVLWEPSLCLCWLVEDSIWFCLRYLFSKATSPEYWSSLRIQDSLTTLEHKIRNKTKWSEDHATTCSVRHGWRGRLHSTVLVTSVLCQLGWGWRSTVNDGSNCTSYRVESLPGRDALSTTKALKLKETAMDSAEWWSTLQHQSPRSTQLASLTWARHQHGQGDRGMLHFNEKKFFF